MANSAVQPYDTYENTTAGNVKDDVIDDIYVISPVDNPVAAMAMTTRAKATLHEWLEDAMRAPKTNAAVEGADAVAVNGHVGDRKNNYTQIFTETARVTGSLEEVDKYGRDSEMAYQLEMKYGELANDEEFSIMGTTGGTGSTTYADGVPQPKAAGAADTTARTLGALRTMVDTNQVVSGASITTLAALETALLALAESIYMSGGNAQYIVTSPKGAREISRLAASTGRTRDLQESRTIVNVVDMYISEFGEMDVVLDRNIVNITSGTVAQRKDYNLLDFNYLSTPVLRPTYDFPLAKLGDSERRQIIRESTFAVLNSKSQGVLHSVTTAALT